MPTATMPNKAYQRAAALRWHPDVRRMLDLVAWSEGVKHGYQSGFNNTVLDKALADHPYTMHSFNQTDGTANKTSAAGRYQFLGDTWTGLKTQLGLTDFGEESQDIGAIQLLIENGAMDKLLAGDWDGALREASPTWVSLPYANAKQPRHSVLDTYAQLRQLGGPDLLSGAVRPPPGVDSELVAQQPPPGPAPQIPQQVPLPPAPPSPPDWAQQVTSEAGMPSLTFSQRPGGVTAPPAPATEPLPGSVDAGDRDAVRALVGRLVPTANATGPDKLLDVPPVEDRFNPVEDARLFSALEADTKYAKSKALADFAGEDYVPEVELPPGIDDSINKYLAQL